MDPRHCRRHVGVLFQDVARYQLTVRDVIGLGDVTRDPDDRSLWTALEAVDAADVVRARGGLDVPVGRVIAGGHDLSGGQWQRLAHARLQFRGAPLWILDEPTSS